MYDKHVVFGVYVIEFGVDIVRFADHYGPE